MGLKGLRIIEIGSGWDENQKGTRPFGWRPRGNA